MPWYYAGPAAKPLGPVSAEELHALRASGTITPETFVIEHTPGATNLAWKRYSEVFPAAPLPLIPPVPPIPAVPPPAPASVSHPTVIPGTLPAPHPLFPSAGPGQDVPPPHPSITHHGAYPPIKPTNRWCAWGFGLSAIGFLLAFACGIGLLPTLIGVVLCIIGLFQLSRNRTQSGQGLAIFGLVISAIALLVAFGFIWWVSGPILKAHGLTVPEQTSNDSE